MDPGFIFRWDEKEIYWQNYDKEKYEGYLESRLFDLLQSGYKVDKFVFYYTKEEAIRDLKYAKKRDRLNS